MTIGHTGVPSMPHAIMHTRLPPLQNDNLWRETSAEKREQERLQFDSINEVRQAAEVHRQVCVCARAHVPVLHPCALRLQLPACDNYCCIKREGRPPGLGPGSGGSKFG